MKIKRYFGDSDNTSNSLFKVKLVRAEKTLGSKTYLSLNM